MILIALGGWKESGKDEVADELVRSCGYAKTFMSESLHDALMLIGDDGPWVRLDYAAGPYEEREFIRYGELVRLVGYVEAKTHKDVRRYLEGLGTDVGRDLNPDGWTEKASRKILDLAAAGQEFIVITGIRYPNELAMAHRHGAFTVWVDRPDKPITGDHDSERSLTKDHFRWSILNDGTLEELHEKARRLATVVEEY